jgi:hypothetical protein
MSRWFSTALTVALLFAGSWAAAADLLPPQTDPAEAIDHYVEAKLKAASVEPAVIADDATILRRTMLDLVGRPPTAGEAKAYLADGSADKRVQLVDRLLASPGYVRHAVNEFDVILGGSGRNSRSMRDYLNLAIAENRPWDVIFREIMAADESEPSRKGVSNFLKARVEELDRVAIETSVTFFGVNVSCAKCHDHPLVPAWTQEHFYGMSSFFNRTFVNGDFLAEREYGLVNYETTTGQKHTAKLMFLTGQVISEPEVAEPKDADKKAEKERLEQAKKDKKPLPPPVFSRRAQLADIALQPEQRHYFAKAIVNQLWNRFYGYGLVMPLDQMHPENKPSHPELLEWLARDLIDHNYDLKRLTRSLVLSKTYARSSRWDKENRPEQSLFAVANVRPLSPAQYASVLGLGTTSPERFSAPNLSADDYETRIKAAEANARGAVDKLEQPREGFQISVDEALLLTNNERVMREVLRDSNESLLFAAKAAAQPREGITIAVWNTLGRAPEEEEIQLLDSYLNRRADRRDEGWKQMIWALLTSSEARFNH